MKTTADTTTSDSSIFQFMATFEMRHLSTHLFEYICRSVPIVAGQMRFLTGQLPPDNTNTRLPAMH
jgi:hypothetical protein